jgi:hydrogenase maturation protein HypF
MARIIVRGVVQGVGFRPTVYRIAKEMGLRGHVKNTGSDVEICLDAHEKEFMEALANALPPLARIDDYAILPEEVTAVDFQIIQSGKGQRLSPIPPDAATCDDCLKELITSRDRRHAFPFINCTNCGARFSVISDVPYDRANTSMEPFPLCSDCGSEYADPLDRRFHAQTISCPKCGPNYTMYDSGSETPISDFAAMIERGAVGAIKSWGGIHLVSLPTESEVLRKRYGRPHKPLAVMIPTLDAARKYAEVSDEEAKMLTSPARPIVLLDKAGHGWQDAVAPGLDKIGLYLPYNALQHMLFGELQTDALIMTSGNVPGEPMVTTDEGALDLNVDCYLVHNRDIINRTDDSVIIPYKDSQFFIRKSRGYVPDPLPVPHNRTLMAMGADMNDAGSISIAGKAIATQHIGDVNHYETAEFLEGSIRHLMTLYGIAKPEAVLVDMHPRYSSRSVGKRMADEMDVPCLEVQHHAAHGFSLAGEHGLDTLKVLSCDGTGYGTDGMIWGGEAMQINEGKWKRLGHLQYIPLLGGDKAVEDPRRIVFAVTRLLGIDQPYFSDQEAAVLNSMMKKSVRTSSCGRVLDALACWLGVCERMTYDGEPAMKLESYLRRGRANYDFQVSVDAGVVDTPALFGKLSEHANPGEHLDSQMVSDMSRSFVETLFEGLIEAANPSDELGFTGGVSYNLVITDILEEKLAERGVKLITHRRVPNGDGGISFGQLIGGGLDVPGNSG